MRIAILGATSHVAKNLIVHLPATYSLVLFARNVDKLTEFIQCEKPEKNSIHIRKLDMFGADDEHVDAVINCIGFGTPEKIKTADMEIFRITEYYDNAILDYLVKHSGTIYINFSSGAVYGTNHAVPINSESQFSIALNKIGKQDAYQISKLNAEAKHRVLEGTTIYDLRLFSLFSRYIDMSSSYLIVEMIKAIREKRPFITDHFDIIRDYVHPEDLADLVKRCINTKENNIALDVYSKAAVKKSELIEVFTERFGMQCLYTDDCRIISPTGIKNQYVSGNHKAGELLGYFPCYTSVESISEELVQLL